MHFTPAEWTRYSRQVILPEVGPLGQQRLKAARVLCIGAGGLGSPLLLYLAAAGVGTIGIADGDALDLTNLQRQVMHDTARIGVNKAESAAATLSALNPEIALRVHAERVNVRTVMGLIADYDVVCDGSDNFPTRFLINDACWFARTPLISASVLRFTGYLTTFAGTAESPCYRCLYPAPPAAGSIPTCAEAGILGAVAGVLGTLQATETLGWILGLGESLVGRLLTFDALGRRFDEKRLLSDPGCPLCGTTPVITELAESPDSGQTPCLAPGGPVPGETSSGA